MNSLFDIAAHSYTRTARPLYDGLREALGRFKPPPKLTVSSWADAYRFLSAEASAEPGRWNCDRAPYQREIMDTITDPTVEETVVMSSAQVGKTSILENMLGYAIHQDPGPMLLIQPTLEIAQAFSKDRLSTMVRDTPALRDLVAEPRARDSASTILHKVFPGGHITMAGANSPASLASRPIRFVFCDEVDRFELSAGGEGDPVGLAYKRSQTFWNRKRALFSTPTEEGVSRIAAAYEESDQRRYFIPCPGCGIYQVLKWAQVKWPRGAAGEHLAHDAYYECEACKKEIALDTEKPDMLRRGEWRAAKPFRGSAGFHINELYSPWSSLPEIVGGHLKALDNPQRRRVWVNTTLGETWKEGGRGVEVESLFTRREPYGPELPDGVLLLTAGIDVQDTRLEVEVVGWGKGEECWGIEKHMVPGDPNQPDVWEKLDEHLTKVYRNRHGLELRIKRACIDTGHLTKVVYNYVRSRQIRGVVAVKGRGGYGLPILGKPSSANMAGVRGVVLIPLGVDEIKTQVYNSLRIQEHGPGYCHFPKGNGYDKDHFDQLTSEQRSTKYSKGVPTFYWHLRKEGARNEALDIRVYAYAALALLNVNWDRLAENTEAKMAPQAQGERSNSADGQAPKTQQEQRKQGGIMGRLKARGHRPGGGGWAKGWR